MCAAIAFTRSSSALSTAVPDAGNASTSSRLAIATPSIPPTRSVWERPTVVTTPMSGRATSHSRAISPNPRIPISNTSTSVSSGALRIVTGRPCSLLKLRSFAVVRRVAAHAAAMKSFVDVLPTLPVTPTTRAVARRRAHRASAINAAAVSATLIASAVTADVGGFAREERDGSGGARLTDEVVAVAFGDDRYEQLSHPGRS